MLPKARDIAERCVRPSHDIGLLWELGIAPEVVEAIHQGWDRPLIAGYYVGVLARRPDLRWIFTTSAVAPDDDELPRRLAWTETDFDRANPTARIEWLWLGVPHETVLSLGLAGVSATDCQEYADATGHSTTAAAQQILAWTRAIHTAPNLPVLALLYAADVPRHLEPSSAAVARLASDLEAEGIRLTTMQTAMLVVAAGCVPTALAWARAGRIDPLDVARAVADGASPPPPIHRPPERM
jgi:hypothetical protein